VPKIKKGSDSCVPLPVDKMLAKAARAACEGVHRISFERENNTRSTNKTLYIHGELADMLSAAFKKIDPDFEKKYTIKAESSGNKISVKDVYGEDFRIDLAIYDKSDAMVAAILVKAPITSVNKNRKNAVGNLVAESIRFFCKENRGVDLLFVNFSPMKVFNVVDSMYRVETCRHLSLYKDIGGVPAISLMMLDESVKKSTYEINIHYDVNIGGWKPRNRKETVKAMSDIEELVPIESVDASQILTFASSFVKRHSCDGGGQ